jgi:hypothetical protein
MKTDRKARSSRKTPLVASLAFACTLAAGSAGAGIPVTDVGNMPNHIITQISSYTSQFQAFGEYAETLKRYQEELRQYQEALTQVANISTTAGLTQNIQVPKSTPAQVNQVIAQRCPSASGGGGLPSIGDLFGEFLPDMNGDIVKEQQRICTQIVQLQYKKHDELVDMLSESETRKNQIEDTIQKARNDKTDGAQKAAQIKMQDLMNKSVSEMQYSQARITAFDGMIASLSAQQVDLANKALGGAKSNSPFEGLVGSLVQGATLELALQGLRTKRDSE